MAAAGLGNTTESLVKKFCVNTVTGRHVNDDADDGRGLDGIPKMFPDAYQVPSGQN